MTVVELHCCYWSHVFSKPLSQSFYFSANHWLTTFTLHALYHFRYRLWQLSLFKVVLCWPILMQQNRKRLYFSKAFKRPCFGPHQPWKFLPWTLLEILLYLSFQCYQITRFATEIQDLWHEDYLIFEIGLHFVIISLSLSLLLGTFLSAMWLLLLQPLHPSQILTLYLQLQQAELQQGVPIRQIPRLNSTCLHHPLQAHQLPPCSVPRCSPHCQTLNSDQRLNPRLPF